MTGKERDLVDRFNAKEAVAFGEIYNMFHKELYTYTSILYSKTHTDADDIIQDIFLKVWNADVYFENIKYIKSYLYTSIKNSHLNHVAHETHVKSYINHVSSRDFDIDIIETELYSYVDEALKLLPESYAEVIKLYLDGYKSGEIAQMLGRNKENVYNIKRKALTELAKKLPSDKLLILKILLIQ